MQNQRTFAKPFSKVAYLTVAALFIGACGMGGALATPTFAPSPTPEASATPTRTATPIPTLTSTATIVPTPAAVGDTVQYGSLEIKVISAISHDLIVPGGLYYYYPTNRKDLFLDLLVLVRNSDPESHIALRWGEVYINQANGKTAYPGFADTMQVEVGSKFNPNKVTISTQVSQSDLITFDKDTYMRLIFVVSRKQALLFGIGDSPQIEIAAR